MKIYSVQVSGGPYPWPYILGLYAAPDKESAIAEAKAEYPEIENAEFFAVRAVGIGE